MPELQTSASNKRRRLDTDNVNHEAWLHSNNTSTTRSGGDDFVLSPTTTLHLDPFSPSFHIESLAANNNNNASTTTTGPSPLTPASSSYDSSAFMQHQHAGHPASVSGFSPEMLHMDPLLSQAYALPPSPDDYATNPTFLASQEELRSLLFNTAQSAHPTRAPSPVGSSIIDGAGGSSGRQSQMRQILASRKRIDYLKNYIAKVAPWVSSIYPCLVYASFLSSICDGRAATTVAPSLLTPPNIKV